MWWVCVHICICAIDSISLGDSSVNDSESTGGTFFQNPPAGPTFSETKVDKIDFSQPEIPSLENAPEIAGSSEESNGMVDNVPNLVTLTPEENVSIENNSEQNSD